MKKLVGITLMMFFLLLQGVDALAYLKPSKTYKNTPEKVKLQAETVVVETPDGARLHTWVFTNQTRKSNDWLIIAHDGMENMGSNLDRVNRFLGNGFNVVCFDYRGYGESSDFEIDEKMYIYGQFCDDLIAEIDWVKRNKAATCFVYGWGIGGGIALGVGYNRPEVKGIIADSPFSSLVDVQKKLKATGVEVDIPDPGYEKNYEPIFALDKKPQPAFQRLIIVVGSIDPIVSEKDAKILINKQKITATMKIVPGVKAEDTYKSDKDKYVKEVSEYMLRR